MRRIIGLAFVAGCVGLAVVIGQRLSADAMAVMVGVVFGVAASIPTSLLVVAATRPRQDSLERRQEEYRPPQQPATQIYVVAPGQQTSWLAAPGADRRLASPASVDSPLIEQPARRFKVVGESDDRLDASPWDR